MAVLWHDHNHWMQTFKLLHEQLDAEIAETVETAVSVFAQYEWWHREFLRSINLNRSYVCRAQSNEKFRWVASAQHHRHNLSMCNTFFSLLVCYSLWYRIYLQRTVSVRTLPVARHSRISHGCCSIFFGPIRAGTSDQTSEHRSEEQNRRQQQKNRVNAYKLLCEHAASAHNLYVNMHEFSLGQHVRMWHNAAHSGLKWTNAKLKLVPSSIITSATIANDYVYSRERTHKLN